jgi:hypothetical protein
MIWHLFFVLPILDFLLFGMWMALPASSLSALVSGTGTIKSRVVSPQMLTYHVLPKTECLPEYATCGVLSRIRTGVLNKLMGTTGRVDNVGCLGAESLA